MQREALASNLLEPVERPMELVFDYAEDFLKDRNELSVEKLGILDEVVNQYGKSLLEADQSFRDLSSPVHVPDLPEGWESSLRVLRIDDKLTLVLAVDEDPIFDRIIITLLRVVSHEDLDPALSSLNDILYGNLKRSDRDQIRKRHVTDYTHI